MQNSALDIWISGAVAVVTVDFLVYPFDTLKTRIQSPNYNTVYKDATTNTVRKNVLFRGLYQGVFSVVLSTIPASGAFFTTYENVKATLNKTKTKSNSAILQATPTPMINAVSSSAGEMVSCFLLTPAEVIKQNAQVIHNTPGGKGKGKARPGNVTLQVLSRFKRYPWKLWSGYTALVGRNLPSTGVNFPIFEAVKGYLVDRRRRRLGHNTATGSSDTTRGRKDIQEEPVFERAVLTGVAASISGSIASVVTTPIDVIKTRMMLAATSDSSFGVSTATKMSREEGNSIWTVGRRIFREEGARGLFRGGAIRVVWTAISFCIYLSMYEGGRFYLEKRRAQRADLDNS